MDVLVSERVPAFALEWLEKLGFNEIHCMRPSEDVVYLDNAIVCSPTRNHHEFHYDFSTFNHWFYQSLEIESQPLNLASEKIFLSRKNLPNTTRALLNRNELELIFKAKGFQILRPETLSVGEQRFVFENARYVAGEAGSALHNNLFCDNNTVFFSLQSEKNRNLIQSSLCGQLSQDIFNIFGCSIGAGYTADFVVSPALVSEVIDLLT
jgi:capsular polysaccharide biosynthesis protein